MRFFFFLAYILLIVCHPLLNPLMTNEKLDLEKRDKPEEATVETSQVYSISTRPEKLIICFLCAFTGFCSSVSMPIYFPILNQVREYFPISESVNNLAVVCYLIFQGIGPALLSPIADVIGRRPLILMLLLLYTVANIALALTRKFWLLLVLRCLQAFSIAPAVSIASGVVGDLVDRESRGSYVGMVSGCLLMGQAIGPLLGGAVDEGFQSWRAVFWFLAVLGMLVFTLDFSFLPETNRSIVGNMSKEPRRLWNYCPILLLPSYQRRLDDSAQTDPHPHYNLLDTFRILIAPPVYLTLIPCSILFASWTCCLTTLATELENHYHYSTLKIGLVFISSGVGCVLGSFATGKILDRSYRCQKLKSEFSIYKARLSIYWVYTLICVASQLTFGWTLDKRTHPAPIIITIFFFTWACLGTMTMSTTLLIDMFPGQSSTATSCVNITRCLMSALFVGVLTKMIAAMTIGGCYTFFAGISLVAMIPVLYVARRGTKYKL